VAVPSLTHPISFLYPELRGFAPTGILELWNNGLWENGTMG